MLIAIICFAICLIILRVQIAVIGFVLKAALLLIVGIPVALLLLGFGLTILAGFVFLAVCIGGCAAMIFVR